MIGLNDYSLEMLKGRRHGRPFACLIESLKPHEVFDAITVDCERHELAAVDLP